MRNALKELLEIIKEENLSVRAASVSKMEDFQKDSGFILYQGYNETELNDFCDYLDFNYDPGYGAQHLDGTIWLTDGSWLERGEYDGSEWWEHRNVPTPPSRD